MSKKSAYRRRRSSTGSCTLTPKAWNRVRAQLGWTLTGEPVPYEACLRLLDSLASEEHIDLQVLIALIVEGWQQSYPLPPQTIILERD